MKIAVLGASGFMGHDLIRFLRQTRPQCAILCLASSAGGLANLSRHAVDIQVIPYSGLADLELGSDVDLLVNYAHPFSVREGLSTRQQTDVLTRFVQRNVQRCAALKVVHVSSMAVYEPFRRGSEPDEGQDVSPLPSDEYACDKWYSEGQMRAAVPGDRLLVLRPTIVYGPFNRYWTDNLLAGLTAGPLQYWDLGGRVQPILVSDISRLVAAQLDAFRAGVYNLGGPQTVTWLDYFALHRDIVGGDGLQQIRRPVPPALWRAYLTHAVAVVRHVLRDPSFRALLRPLARRVPEGLGDWVRSRVPSSASRPTGAPSLAPSAPAPQEQRYDVLRSAGEVQAMCMTDYFATDRLVSLQRFRNDFPGWALTSLDEARPLLAEYYRFRFTDRVYTGS